MRHIFFGNRWKTVRFGMALASLGLCTLMTARAQGQHGNPNVRLGQKALLDGDFKAAAAHLQKALPVEASDPDVHYLLGYSQFLSGEFAESIKTFEKVIALDAKHASAWYYKAKAGNNLAVTGDSGSDLAAKENLLETAVGDYGKAIAIDANDIKLYQNRAVAYRDLGILTGTHETANYNKQKAEDAYNKAIADYQKVLARDPSRKDIQTEIKKATIYRDNLR